MMPVCLQTLKMSIVGRKRLFFVVTLFLCLAVFMDLCTYNIVGFVAAAVSMPMGGCRARRPVVDVSVTVVAVDIPIAAELAVL